MMNGLLRKAIVFLVAMAFLGLGGWFGRMAYKHASERRLIRQAKSSLQKKDFREAGLCIQRALQINPFSKEATRLMADTWEDIDASSALGWRVRLAQLEPNNVTNRLKWAQTAIAARDVRSAAEAMAGIPEKDRKSAWYHKLAGYMAWSTGNGPIAEKEYLEALRLEPTNAAVMLNLETVLLASTNQATAEAARLSMEQLATNPAVRMAALHHLAAEAIARTNFSRALGFSRQLVNEPNVSFAQKIDHLQLLKVARDPDFDPFLKAMKQEAATAPVLAFGLSRWMLTTEGPVVTLRWLDSLPAGIATNQPVPMVYADCYIASTNWQGLLSLVQKQDWKEANSFKSALECLALRSLGQNIPAQAAWRKASRLAAHRLDAMARLDQFAAAWKWREENRELLQQIVSEFPREKWAADQLMGQLYQEGNTSALASLLSKMCNADPTDARVKNNLAIIYLLRKTELDKAYRLAREAYLTSTNDPFMASTYAYSLLLQNKPDQALKVVSQIDTRFLQNPSVAAYYGLIQVESGHKDAAREPLQRAAASSLLPEEKQLVRVALAKL